MRSPETSSSASSDDDLLCIDSDEDCKSEMYEEDNEDKQQEVAPGKWVLLKYCTKKRVKHFVGQVTKKTDEGLESLPEPISGRQGNHFVFRVDFAGYNL
ncbi:hypothetical protein ILUMI_17627 [Ignelater luminosus]|uniref:Uncharacterized protein n=1 Tax=Ignelater luminosus TaxID=2038154 RepID=A0A8K0CQP4_IGNLU|nr:hypothetical protein ILUMI_17627 [Ignelater luminosus]